MTQYKTNRSVLESTLYRISYQQSTTAFSNTLWQFKLLSIWSLINNKYSTKFSLNVWKHGSQGKGLVKISLKGCLSKINYRTYFSEILLTNITRLDSSLYNMIYYTNNQPYLIQHILNRIFPWKVNGKESLLQYLYQPSTTAHIFPTADELILYDWALISITVSLISITNHKFSHKIWTMVSKVMYWKRNNS